MWCGLFTGFIRQPWARWAAAIALVAVMILLSACERAGSDLSPLACPPPVEYTGSKQTHICRR